MTFKGFFHSGIVNLRVKNTLELGLDDNNSSIQLLIIFLPRIATLP